MNKIKQTNTHEPFVHIVKRDKLPWWKAWGIRVAAVALSLVLCAIVTKLIVGVSPLDLFSKFTKGFLGSKNASIPYNQQFWLTLQQTAILLCIALAITPAFKMRFWNIGAEGQVMMGCFASAGTMIAIGKMVKGGEAFSYELTFLLMFVAAVLAGAIWAVIPALFKVKWNTNETLFTLMMNYIAIQLTAYFCKEHWSPKNTSNVVQEINTDVFTESGERYGWLPKLFSDSLTQKGSYPWVSEWLIVVITAVIITFLVYVYLKYSKQGYELSVVGESENTARYVGINVSKVVLRTMLISGALCGLVGFLLVSGIQHSISTTIVDGRGFTAIMVSWMSKFNPFVMAAVAFLFVFLDNGASMAASDLGVNESFSDILTALIIFFIIGCEFFINYKVVFRRHSKKEA